MTGHFPNTRLRRTRATGWSRALHRETVLTPADLIWPLFVTEGPSADKLKTIRSSDYLSFCYEQLLTHKGALCIFGHDLGPQDKHLVDAIRQARPTTLAISVSGRSDGFIRQQKRRYSELFDGSGAAEGVGRDGYIHETLLISQNEECQISKSNFVTGTH